MKRYLGCVLMLVMTTFMTGCQTANVDPNQEMMAVQQMQQPTGGEQAALAAHKTY